MSAAVPNGSGIGSPSPRSGFTSAAGVLPAPSQSNSESARSRVFSALSLRAVSCRRAPESRFISATYPAFISSWRLKNAAYDGTWHRGHLSWLPNREPSSAMICSCRHDSCLLSINSYPSTMPHLWQLGCPDSRWFQTNSCEQSARRASMKAESPEASYFAARRQSALSSSRERTDGRSPNFALISECCWRDTSIVIFIVTPSLPSSQRRGGPSLPGDLATVSATASLSASLATTANDEHPLSRAIVSHRCAPSDISSLSLMLSPPRAKLSRRQACHSLSLIL